MCVNLLLLVKTVLKQTSSSTPFLNYPTSNCHREQRNRRYTQEKKKKEKDEYSKRLRGGGVGE